jgi:fatty acid desaturase
LQTLYILKGDERREDNYINIAAILFMWVTLPAFGAAAYIPSLVLGAFCVLANATLPWLA